MNKINKPGIFIAFEGIDGSGKSTQIRRLVNSLSLHNIKCYSTREPTDSPIGSLIHQIMTGRILANNKVIAGLFVADRIDHLTNLTDGIYNKIKSGTHVISDRYYFSSYAYHGVDMDIDWVINSNKISADMLRPTLTIFLDIPVHKALERLRKDRFHAELFEAEERLIKVREKYFQAFDMLKSVENIAIIDADADIDTITERIWNTVSDLFITNE